MKGNKKYIVLTVFIASFITIGCIFLPHQPLISDTHINEDGLIGINTSNGDGIFNETDVYLNDSHVITLFESIRIDINTSAFLSPSANYTEIQFIYSDGTEFVANMTYVPEYNFTYTYTPSYDVPTGEHKIYFQIYEDDGTLMNDNTTEIPFTVDSSYYDANFQQGDDLYLGDILDVELFIQNISNYRFKYNVSVVDSTNESNQNDLMFIGNEIKWFNRTIEESKFSVNKVYYVKANLTDTNSGKVKATYFPFTVLNRNPNILESTVELPTEIYRATTYFVSLNITDVESEHPDNLTVSMSFTDKFGNQIGSFSKILSPDEYYNYSSTFSIGPSNPVGTYYAKITATDFDDGSSSYIKTVEVKNNLPEINSYKINGRGSSESISVNYGDNLDFTFNITDKDSSVQFVTVSLLGSDGDWFNITREYSNDMKISISTYDLVQGTWYVYITALDADGGRITLGSDYGTAPQQIQVIPDILSDILPWVALVIGIVLGLLIGTGIAYKLLKRRMEKGLEPKEETKTEKKKGKIAKKKPSADKKEEDTEEEGEEEDVKPSKRKIKRGF